MSGVVVRSEGDTELAARALAGQCRGGLTIGLSGDLGAGKTTLVRYLVNALGGRASEVSSPSYTLEHEYRLPDRLRVDHWDLYRLKALPEELHEPPDAGTIRIIEWPETCSELCGRLDLTITLKVLELNAREIVCSGPLAERVMTALRAEIR